MTLGVHRRRQAALCRRSRIWLNGTEVTSRCVYADMRRGVVRLYALNAEGKKYADGDRVATEERRGHVVHRYA